MQIFIRPQLPPLIITSAGQFTVCNSAYEIHEWLTPGTMDISDGFVICDPTGYLLHRYDKIFRRGGYTVKTFDTGNISECSSYNPLAYLRADKDIPKLVTAFIRNTDSFCCPGDIKFRTAETSLLAALFGYVANEIKADELNIGTVIEMLKYMRIDSGWGDYGDYDHKHAVDIIFEDLREHAPYSYPSQRYEDFKMTAWHVANLVVDSCILRLKPFADNSIKDRFSTDELGLDSFGFGSKTALFVSPCAGGYFDFLVPLLYTQLFDLLCEASV